MNIAEALKELNPTNDEHWTADGLPRMDVVEGLIGDKSITRADVTNTQPDFNRAAAVSPDAGEEAALTPGAKADENIDHDYGDDAGAGFNDEHTPSSTPEPEAEFEISDDPEAISKMVLNELNLQSDVELKKLSKDELEEERDRLATEMIKSQGVMEQAKKIADTLANAVNSLNRRIDVLQKADPNHSTAGIRAYLKQQNANRLARARGLTKFIDLTGIHPKDVASATDTKAPIDRAMNARKPARGSVRPNYGR